jgi:hypothetical protein
MNAKWNAKGAIPAITHLNSTSEIAVQYSHTMITAARMFNKAVVVFEGTVSWYRQ